jgi:antitoxin component of RelBE/YafQ-DinJ toxin-antitoxin module
MELPFDLNTNEPNAETLQACEETENPENLPSYGSFNELRLDQDLQ